MALSSALDDLSSLHSRKIGGDPECIGHAFLPIRDRHLRRLRSRPKAFQKASPHAFAPVNFRIRSAICLAAAYCIWLIASRYLINLKAAMPMKRKTLPLRLDLLDVRRQLVEMRSLHSNDPRITTAINRLISKLAHLSEPEDRRDEQRLLSMIAKTLQRVEAILSRDGKDAKPS
jgi:hypothetical protein